MQGEARHDKATADDGAHFPTGDGTSASVQLRLFALLARAHGPADPRKCSPSIRVARRRCPLRAAFGAYFMLAASCLSIVVTTTPATRASIRPRSAHSTTSSAGGNGVRH